MRSEMGSLSNQCIQNGGPRIKKNIRLALDLSGTERLGAS